MTYRVLRDCMIGGAKVRAGDLIHLNESMARQLMSIGRVVPDDAMPKTSDRQVKEVQSRGTSKAAPRKQSRTSGSSSKYAGRNGGATSSTKHSDD